MTETTKLVFSLKDNILGEELSPSNTTLPLLGEFIDQVSTFLKGEKRIDLTQIKSSLTFGSIVLTAYNNTGTLDSAFNDYQYIAEHGSIDTIDPIRARVIEKWQKAAKDNEFRTYTLFLGSTESNISTVKIDSTTNFVVSKRIWVDVDLYLYGTIFDLGGKYKSNVHLGLENGATIKIEADTSFLSQDNENRLYKHQLVRIKAKQNILTHELKNEMLVSFEAYEPRFDEDEFNQMVEKSTMAWKSVANPTKWVEEIRGNNAQ